MGSCCSSSDTNAPNSSPSLSPNVNRRGKNALPPLSPELEKVFEALKETEVAPIRDYLNLIANDKEKRNELKSTLDPKTGRNLLMQSCCPNETHSTDKRVEIVKLLTNSKIFNLDEKCSHTGDPNLQPTALCFACLGHTSDPNALAVQELLLHGADPTITISKDGGAFALNLACKYSHHNAVSAILGTKKHTDEQLTMVLCYLCKTTDNVRAAEMLVNNGADVHGGTGFNHTNPLVGAVKENHVEIVQFLLKKGADFALHQDTIMKVYENRRENKKSESEEAKSQNLKQLLLRPDKLDALTTKLLGAKHGKTPNFYLSKEFVDSEWFTSQIKNQMELLLALNSNNTNNNNNSFRQGTNTSRRESFRNNSVDYSNSLTMTPHGNAKKSSFSFPSQQHIEGIGLHRPENLRVSDAVFCGLPRVLELLFKSGSEEFLINDQQPLQYFPCARDEDYEFDALCVAACWVGSRSMIVIDDYLAFECSKHLLRNYKVSTTTMNVGQNNNNKSPSLGPSRESSIPNAESMSAVPSAEPFADRNHSSNESNNTPANRPNTLQHKRVSPLLLACANHCDSVRLVQLFVESGKFNISETTDYFANNSDSNTAMNYATPSRENMMNTPQSRQQQHHHQCRYHRPLNALEVAFVFDNYFVFRYLLSLDEFKKTFDVNALSELPYHDMKASSFTLKHKRSFLRHHLGLAISDTELRILGDDRPRSEAYWKKRLEKYKKRFENFEDVVKKDFEKACLAQLKYENYSTAQIRFQTFVKSREAAYDNNNNDEEENGRSNNTSSNLDDDDIKYDEDPVLLEERVQLASALSRSVSKEQLRIELEPCIVCFNGFHQDLLEIYSKRELIHESNEVAIANANEVLKEISERKIQEYENKKNTNSPQNK